MSSDHDLPSLHPQDSIKSSLYEKRPIRREVSHESNIPLTKLPSVSSENFSKEAFIKEPATQVPYQVREATQKMVSPTDKVVIDPTTVMQIAVMYKKLNYYGINVDKSRIKISTHKPIKKEEYVTLSKEETNEEQYYRTGVKPKVDSEFDTNVTGVKYSIFRARNGRVMVLRKIKDGSYKVFDAKTRIEFDRIKPEHSGSLKRIKLTENDEYEGVINHFNPVVQKDVKMEYEDLIYEPEPDSDEEMSDNDTKEELDDYTEGFISRHRKRKGKKRGTNDYKISVMV